MSAHLRIQGGTVLVGGELIDAAVDIEPGFIIAVGSEMGPGRSLDARGLFVLPGIVDIHGDAFERQLMPRPGVNFPLAIALQDSDRQAIGNGITTVFHGVTTSWEPGLRSMETARAIVQELERARPELAADTRLHLRYETYNLEAATEIADWIAMRRIDMLGFNDHLPGKNGPPRVRKIEQMAERAGLSPQDFIRLVERLKARGEEVPQAIARLAMVAREHGVPSLSHDDMRPDQRQWFRALHCRIAEFPTTVETAEHAIGSGDDVVLGAPNVVRGGSHVGWINATDMIKRGLCTVLASDYYYPAPLLAAFRLAAEQVAPLGRAWSYVSERPARAAMLNDRGCIEAGRRADLILVDGRARQPNVVATIANGRVVHLTDSSRLH